MTREEKRIKIAEACGWRQVQGSDGDYINGPSPTYHWTNGVDWADESGEDLPDYFGSLDAIHQAEKCLPERTERGPWRMRLEDICGTMKGMLHATAEQRAEAFGISLNLWKEGE